MREFTQELNGEATTVVNDTNTAIAAGSGSLPVFGTPFMIALMEKATCNAVEPMLDKGETTVGIHINISHDKASGIGTAITAQATLTEVEGRKLTFNVIASEDNGAVIGKGTITRFAVDSERFMAKLNK